MSFNIARYAGFVKGLRPHRARTGSDGASGATRCPQGALEARSVREQNERDAELRAEAERLRRENPTLPEAELRRIQGTYLGPVAARAARYDGDLDARSHGEAFLAFFAGRLRGRGLYLLDEPEAALSPLRQLAFLSILAEGVAAGAQFVIATHAPVVMAAPGARPLEIRDGRLRATPFDDLEHVRILREFLAAPEAYLRHL